MSKIQNTVLFTKLISLSLVTLSLTTLSLSAHADPQCTTEPQEKWQDQEMFQKQLSEQGYEVKKFKVTSTNCYEIYGRNANKQKVEIYFNPVDGNVVKQEIDD